MEGGLGYRGAGVTMRLNDRETRLVGGKGEN